MPQKNKMKRFFQEDSKRLLFIEKEAVNTFCDQLCDDNVSNDGFYQFALDQNQGFFVLKFECLNCLKGLKEEVKFSCKSFGSIYNAKTLVMEIIRSLPTCPLIFSNHPILITAKK